MLLGGSFYWAGSLLSSGWKGRLGEGVLSLPELAGGLAALAGWAAIRFSELGIRRQYACERTGFRRSARARKNHPFSRGWRPDLRESLKGLPAGRRPTAAKYHNYWKPGTCVSFHFWRARRRLFALSAPPTCSWGARTNAITRTGYGACRLAANRPSTYRCRAGRSTQRCGGASHREKNCIVSTAT